MKAIAWLLIGGSVGILWQRTVANESRLPPLIISLADCQDRGYVGAVGVASRHFDCRYPDGAAIRLVMLSALPEAK